MMTKQSLALSVYSGAGFLLFPFLQYVTCCLQCSFLLKNTTALVSGSQPNPIPPLTAAIVDTKILLSFWTIAGSA